MLQSFEIVLIIAGVILRLFISGSTAGTGLNLLIGLFVWMALLLQLARKPADDKLNPHASLLTTGYLPLLFAACIIYGFIIAPYKFGVLQYAFGWLTDIILFYLVVRLEKPYLFVSVLAGVAVLIVFYALYQHFWGLDALRQAVAQNPSLLDFIPEELRKEFIGRLNSNEPFGTFTYQNSMGGFLVLTIPIMLAARYIFRRPLSFIFLISSVISLYVLYSTGAKGAWVALAVGLAIWGILSIQSAPKRRIVTLICVIFGLICVICGFIWPPASLAIRFGYWQGALEIIKHHPFGVGINGFPDAYLLYKSAEAGITQKTHNDFLQIGAEMGIIGLIVFVAIFGLILVRGLKAINRADNIKEKAVLIGLVAGLTGFLVHCTVDFNFYVQGLSMSAWLVAGCLASMTQGKMKDEKVEMKGNPILRYTQLTGCFIVFLGIIWITPKINISQSFLELGKELVRSDSTTDIRRGKLYLEKAMCSNPYSVDVWLELAWTYHHNADCKLKTKALYPEIPDTPILTCIYCLDKAIELSPKTSILYYYQGILYQDHAKTSGQKTAELFNKKAEECFNKARQLYPTNNYPADRK